MTVAFEPCSELLVMIGDISAYVLAAISPFCFVFVIWIVYYKSPPAMGAYKWYIILNATSLMLVEWIVNFAHPEPLLPYGIIVGRNIAGLFVAPDIVCIVYAEFTTFLVIMSFYLTTVQFLFRYCQTANNVFYRLVSERNYAIPISTVLLALLNCSVAGPLNWAWSPRDELLSSMREENQYYYAKMVNASFIGIQRSTSNAHLVTGVFVVVFVCMAAVIVIASSIGCYSFLRQNSHSLSRRTISLYWTLINALIAEMVLAGFAVFLPLMISLLAFQFRWRHAATVVSISITILCWYPIFAHVLLLTYIKPYRIAALKMVRFPTVSMVFEKRSKTSVAPRMKELNSLPK